MSNLVATINGKKIYSDKIVDRIINTRVKFTDGSWCDVSTGIIVNQGKGSINIGSLVDSATKQTIEQRKTYMASILKVKDVCADIDVQPHKANNVEVTITGPTSLVNTVSVSQVGDTVVIEGDRGKNIHSKITMISGRGGRTVICSGRGSPPNIISANTVIEDGDGDIICCGNGSIAIGGQNISIANGCGEENLVKIIVKVPNGASVNLSGISGSSTVGDTKGSLQVEASGGDIDVGCVGNATLSVQGGSDINVEEVKGTLAINITGSGDVQVHDGAVSSLSINVAGSGDANFGGRAGTAMLNVVGSGDINVAYVKERPIKNVTGSGDISVKNWR